MLQIVRAAYKQLPLWRSNSMLSVLSVEACCKGLLLEQMRCAGAWLCVAWAP